MERRLLALESREIDPSVESFRNEVRDQLAVIKKSISTLSKTIGHLSGISETIIGSLNEVKAAISDDGEGTGTIAERIKKVEEHVDDLTDYADAIAPLPRNLDSVFYMVKRIDENVANLRASPPMSTKTRDELITSFTESILKQSLAKFRKDFLEETATVMTSLLNSHVDRIVKSLPSISDPSREQVTERAISKAISKVASGMTDGATAPEHNAALAQVDRELATLFRTMIGRYFSAMGTAEEPLHSDQPGSSSVTPVTSQNSAGAEVLGLNISVMDDLLLSPPMVSEVETTRPLPTSRTPSRPESPALSNTPAPADAADHNTAPASSSHLPDPAPSPKSVQNTDVTELPAPRPMVIDKINFLDSISFD